MVEMGCTKDGYLNDSKFNQPMPMIGIYIAVGSAACALAMAVDALHGFRYKKLWFPCKFCSLNATILTVIAVATKLSVDLTDSLPRRQDQLAKLSSGALICTVMGNFMPSIGVMENKEMAMNLVALGILVITACVNICIQLATGVIYVFWQEHAFILFLMLILLALLGSSALTVPTTKRYFDLKYTRKHEKTIEECTKNMEKRIVEKLRSELKRFWVMAHTCDPQFVIGRSATCAASGAFCLLAAMTLAEAMLRSYLMPWCFNFCHGISPYSWTTTSILVAQVIAVIAGTIAPAFRWFNAIHFKNPQKADKACNKNILRVERYWIKVLVEWKECPLEWQFHGWHRNKLAHDVKKLLLNLCIQVQTGVVVMSKLVQLISIYFMSRLLMCLRYCIELKWLFKHRNIVANNDSRSGSHEPGSKQDIISRYVLHLEGEEQLVDLMVQHNCEAPDHWFSMGKQNQPKQLIQLLERFRTKEFKGVFEFDSEQVPSLDVEEPPNCWALPVVTLTSIAVAIPGIDYESIEHLLRSVNGGLAYLRVIENNLNAKEEFANLRKAAEILWLQVHIYRRWLDVDLRKMALQGLGPEKVIEELADIAKNRFLEYKRKYAIEFLKDSPSMWPIKALAANSMYRISRTILLEYQNRDYKGCDKLFTRLSAIIAEILGACLTNLPRVIPMESHRGTIEKREESVLHAMVLLGKTEKILEILDKLQLPSSDPERLASIDGWRAVNKQNTSPQLLSSTKVGGTAASNSSDVYLSIE